MAFGAQAWPSASEPSPTPTAPSYASRTITFENHTDYPIIQIGEACDTSTGKNSAPSCQNTPTRATILKDASYTVKVGVDGLDSAAFYLSSFCTADSAAACGNAPTKAQCDAGTPPAHWVCTGGYFDGETPYATKIEFTILTVTGGVPAGASNVDVSAVDGYAASVALYPKGEYCTYTVPPENSNILGAGHYDSSAPLARLAPPAGSSLEKLCGQSSQLPPNGSGTAWDLSKKDSSGAFAGCMSPCAYAEAHGSPLADLFCCTGSYHSPDACVQGNGTLSASTSTYNRNVVGSFQNVYGFAFGDAGSDYACPPDTDFVVEFLPG